MVAGECSPTGTNPRPPIYHETSIRDYPGLRDCADRLFDLDFSCSCRSAQPGRDIGLRLFLGGHPAQYHLHGHCGFQIYRETRACRHRLQNNGIRGSRRSRRHSDPAGLRMGGAPGWFVRELDTNPQGHHDPCQPMIRDPRNFNPASPHAGGEMRDSTALENRLGFPHGKRIRAVPCPPSGQSIHRPPSRTLLAAKSPSGPSLWPFSRHFVTLYPKTALRIACPPSILRVEASKMRFFHRKAAKVAKETQRGWNSGRRRRRCGWQIIPQNPISQRMISAFPLRPLRLCGKSNAFCDSPALHPCHRPSRLLDIHHRHSAIFQSKIILTGCADGCHHLIIRKTEACISNSLTDPDNPASLTKFPAPSITPPPSRSIDIQSLTT